jgi:hypothetical protein
MDFLCTEYPNAVWIPLAAHRLRSDREQKSVLCSSASHGIFLLPFMRTSQSILYHEVHEPYSARKLTTAAKMNLKKDAGRHGEPTPFTTTFSHFGMKGRVGKCTTLDPISDRSIQLSLLLLRLYCGHGLCLELFLVLSTVIAACFTGYWKASILLLRSYPRNPSFCACLESSIVICSSHYPKAYAPNPRLSA